MTQEWYKGGTEKRTERIRRVFNHAQDGFRVDLHDIPGIPGCEIDLDPGDVDLYITSRAGRVRGQSKRSTIARRVRSPAGLRESIRLLYGMKSP